ncbi:MAG: FCD domain-containing protein [Micrococcaceae bacterium]
MRRRTPLGEALEADIIAAELGTDVAFVYNALVRLTAEGLVKRPHEGGFTPMPVTVDLVDNLYHARATIESGVIDAYLASASDEAISEIIRLAKDLFDSEPHTSAELDDFLAANLDFHSAIVGLAGSRQLVSHFRQLSLSTLWRDTYLSDVWQQKTGHPLIPRLAEAISARDTATAHELVRTQVSFVKQAAQNMINQQGGAL